MIRLNERETFHQVPTTFKLVTLHAITAMSKERLITYLDELAKYSFSFPRCSTTEREFQGALRIVGSLTLFIWWWDCYTSCSRAKLLNIPKLAIFLHLQDVQHLVISSSDRSLTIYDVVTLSHSPVFCITGLTHIPTVRYLYIMFSFIGICNKTESIKTFRQVKP